jgi:hypothetical protein
MKRFVFGCGTHRADVCDRSGGRYTDQWSGSATASTNNVKHEHEHVTDKRGTHDHYSDRSLNQDRSQVKSRCPVGGKGEVCAVVYMQL